MADRDSEHFNIFWNVKIPDDCDVILPSGKSLKQMDGVFALFSAEDANLTQHHKNKISVDAESYLIYFCISNDFLTKIVDFELSGRGPVGVRVGVDMWKYSKEDIMISTFKEELQIIQGRSAVWMVDAVDFFWISHKK
ncbi:hypothetical protein [Asticcacaulis sp. EMRT-3]|uniref:hypothetical protein n=1 Tax=Asticcacaulis sp. EMRT-3 TaxID=3040349 RepID=UPI0024AF1970|nr:hypothetical protein [Asticcacaulis sp. EMRT-3]MDI7774397.1 hypothetical protein [Asticcacaulis sp. EMRT-3]